MLTTAALLTFLSLGVLDVWAVMLVLTREFAVTSVRLMAAGRGKVVAASFAGKMKTVAQYVAIIAMIVALQWQECGTWLPLPSLCFSIPVLIAQILLWIAVVLTVISGVQYCWTLREYFTQDK